MTAGKTRMDPAMLRLFPPRSRHPPGARRTAGRPSRRSINTPSLDRRSFLRSTAALAALAAMRPAQSRLAAADSKSSETIVKLLFDSLQPKQKAQIWFPWDHVDPQRGLLRTRIQNN